MCDYVECVDASGLNCPLPLLRAKKALSKINAGEVLYVIATDEGAQTDFQAFCKQTGNLLLKQYSDDRAFHFFLQKR